MNLLQKHLKMQLQRLQLNKQNANWSTSKINFGVLLIVYKSVKIKYNYNIKTFDVYIKCYLLVQ